MKAKRAHTSQNHPTQGEQGRLGHKLILISHSLNTAYGPLILHKANSILNGSVDSQVVITEKGWDMIAFTASIDLALVYCSFQNCIVSSLRM